jgi:DnaK suppressor protein
MPTGPGTDRQDQPMVTRQDAVIGLAVREDEPPWTEEELDAVRSELSGELGRIEGEVATLQSSIADVLRDSGDGAGDDQADTGSKAFEREQEMTLLANTRESLFQTQHALRRISDGSYGSCESCGQPIGKLRLQAFPRATQCVSCKQKAERR